MNVEMIYFCGGGYWEQSSIRKPYSAWECDLLGAT